ncbi:YdcF family protein [Candidatus Kaiserbacteria bacterium]|nr:YdcF family protein [Candidatus Kaiserbacteria bacterium]
MGTDALAKIIWDYMLMHHSLEKADAIFVLGSSDIRVAGYAAMLYLDGWAPLIIFSGNTGTRGKARELWGMSEAEKFASTARDMGVPETAMLLEKESTNTEQNITFTKKLLEEKSLHPKKLILVQKPYMERRTYATFIQQWPEMDFIVTSPPISFEDYPTADRTKEYVINMIVGDMQRIREYPAKGFQIEQEIPAEAWEAYEELVRRGYTEDLIKE